MEELDKLSGENLEIIANDIGKLGIKHRKEGDVINARKCYAVSLALNSYLEKYEFMHLFNELLRTTNLSDEKFEEYKKWGRDVIVWALGLPSLVRKTLDAE